MVLLRTESKAIFVLCKYSASETCPSLEIPHEMYYLVKINFVIIKQLLYLIYKNFAIFI